MELDFHRVYNCTHMRSIVVFVVIFLIGLPAACSDVFPVRLSSFDYPNLAVQAIMAGPVVLEVTLAAGGDVSRTKVISGHPILANAAVTAITRWRFDHRCPDKKQDGEEPFQITFDFKIEGVVSDRPRTKLEYHYPNRVVIMGEATHYQPAGK